MDRTDTPVRETERVRDEEAYRGPVGPIVRHLNVLDWVAIWLTIIGGINWLTIGIFDFNFVSAIFGVMSTLSRIIYTLVGLSALYLIYLSTRLLKQAVPTTSKV